MTTYTPRADSADQLPPSIELPLTRQIVDALETIETEFGDLLVDYDKSVIWQALAKYAVRREAERCIELRRRRAHALGLTHDMGPGPASRLHHLRAASARGQVQNVVDELRKQDSDRGAAEQHHADQQEVEPEPDDLH